MIVPTFILGALFASCISALVMFRMTVVARRIIARKQAIIEEMSRDLATFRFQKAKQNRVFGGTVEEMKRN